MKNKTFCIGQGGEEENSSKALNLIRIDVQAERIDV